MGRMQLPVLFDGSSAVDQSTITGERCGNVLRCLCPWPSLNSTWSPGLALGRGPSTGLPAELRLTLLPGAMP